MIIEESYQVQTLVNASWYAIDHFNYGLSLGTTYQDAQENYLKMKNTYPSDSYRIIKITTKVVPSPERFI